MTARHEILGRKVQLYKRPKGGGESRSSKKIGRTVRPVPVRVRPPAPVAQQQAYQRLIHTSSVPLSILLFCFTTTGRAVNPKVCTLAARASAAALSPSLKRISDVPAAEAVRSPPSLMP